MGPKTLSIVAIAAICHEANRALCAGLGDFSQPTWGYAPEWQAQSAITGVKFNLANPGAPASASHDSWLEEKRRDGWKYGEVKDAEKKEHPCFVPYEALPLDQQAKDHLFKSIVATMSPLLAPSESYGEPKPDTSIEVSHPVMRAKMIVSVVEKCGENEHLGMRAVAKNQYDETGADEDNTYAHFSPNGNLDLYVANPNLVGKIRPGQKYYLDFTLAPS